MTDATEADVRTVYAFCGRFVSSVEALLDPGPLSQAFVRQQARETLVEFREWQQRHDDELLDQDNALADLEDYRRAETETA